MLILSIIATRQVILTMFTCCLDTSLCNNDNLLTIFTLKENTVGYVVFITYNADKNLEKAKLLSIKNLTQVICLSSMPLAAIISQLAHHIFLEVFGLGCDRNF